MNGAVVVDASAFVDYLLHTERYERIRDVIESPVAEIHAPWLCDVEVCSAIREAVRGRRATLEHALSAIDVYSKFPIVRHGTAGLFHAIFALRDNFAAYDAAYVVVALALDASLLTTDDRLARAVEKYTSVPLR